MSSKRISVWSGLLLCVVSVASVLFLNPSNAAASVCSNGFDRPLLFGILPVARGGAEVEIKELNGTSTVLPFNWPDFEGSEGSFNAEYMDFGVRKVKEADLTIIGWINGTPDWAKADPSLPAHKSLPRRDKRSQYERFVREIVTRHRNDIRYWMYWNEPNGCGSNASSCGASESNAQEYVYWLNVTYDVIKSIDPSIQVVAGNLDFNRSDTQYIRWMNNANAKYDALSIHPYTGKGGSEPQDFSRIRAAYDAQTTKKPIWIGEWGWDLNWSGMTENVAAGYIQQALREFARPENSYIQAAFYHVLRDEGGAYGLRDGNGPRAHGAAFRDTTAELCTQGTPPPPPTPPPSTPTPPPVTPPPQTPQCLFTKVDVSAIRLNQQHVIMSQSNLTDGGMEYWFFNAGNKQDSYPLPYCVQGQSPKEEDGCPAGSGQLVIQASPGGTGPLNAQADALLPNNTYYQAYWRGTFEWSRVVPLTVNGEVDFQNSRPFLAPTTLEQLQDSTGKTGMVTATGLVAVSNTTLLQSVWQGTVGSYRYVPFNSNSGLPDWNAAGSWQELVPISGVPGSGPILAETLYRLPNNRIRQIVWRTNQKYERDIPISGNQANFSSPTAQEWRGPVSEQLPGTGTITTFLASELPQNKFIEGYWRNGEGRVRSYSMGSAGPDTASAPAFSNPAQLSALQNDGSYFHAVVSHAQLSSPDMHPNWQAQFPGQLKAPEGIFVVGIAHKGNNTSQLVDECIVMLQKESDIPGDIDKDGDVDIFDYNQLVQYFGTEQCEKNITGSCTIDIFDYNVVVQNFGKS